MLPLGMALPPPVFMAPPPDEPAEGLASLRPVIRAVVTRVLGAGASRADVEDCTSETFRRALEGQGRLQPGAPLGPWVVGIARHVALDAGRARSRSLARTGRSRDAEGDGLDAVPDSGPAPDLLVQRAEVQSKVRAALAELSDDQRRALELFHLEGLAYREIAARLEVPLGTVCTWVARGRRALARAFPEGRDA